MLFRSIAMVPASVQTVKKQMQGDFVRVFSRFRYLEAGAGALTPEQKKTLVKELPNTRILNTGVHLKAAVLSF